jgi:SAM-dependent methyltransferase
MEKPYQIIDGIRCYAPELAFTSANYSPDYFDKIFSLEEKNFWFRSRNRIIRFLFEKYLGISRPASVLEIGVGTGYVLEELSRIKNYRVFGAELHLDGLKYARNRLPNVEFVQLDATQMPYREEFDAIGAFDVLEHIQEDAKVMESVGRSLKTNGLFFITAPQYKWFWSKQDEGAYHKRRYSKKEMRSKLETAGFQIEFMGSYVSILFPVMALVRLPILKKYPSKPGATCQIKADYDFDELRMPPAVDWLFEYIMRAEEFLLRRGFRFPFGGSLAIVARKK